MVRRRRVRLPDHHHGTGVPARGGQVRADPVPAGNLRRHLHCPPAGRSHLRLARRQGGPPEGPRLDPDADGREHVRRRPAARLRADRHVGCCPAGAAQARPGLLHRRRVRRCHHLRERILPGQAPRLLRQLPGHGQLPRLRPRRRPRLRPAADPRPGRHGGVGLADPVPHCRPAGPDRGLLPEQDRGIPAVPGHPGRPGEPTPRTPPPPTSPPPRARWASSRPTGVHSSSP